MAFSFRKPFCCRLFEPDPAAFGSTSEIDGCEKVLADLLARVVQRKVSESRSQPAANLILIQQCANFELPPGVSAELLAGRSHDPVRSDSIWDGGNHLLFFCFFQLLFFKVKDDIVWEPADFYMKNDASCRGQMERRCTRARRRAWALSPATPRCGPPPAWGQTTPATRCSARPTR